MSRKFPTEVDTIQEKINELIEALQKNNYHIKKISAQELLTYFEGNAPSGDVITLQDVLGSEWLLIHEIVEINELKKKGLVISSELLFTHAELVFETHLIATEWELKLANEKNDVDWIKRRLNDIKTWTEDPTISTRLKEKCINLFRMFEKK